jgi:hypothetical protein
MSHKGDWHRIGSFKDYQNNLDEVREKMKNVTGTPCQRHESFNKYCVDCWRVTENQPTPPNNANPLHP